MAAYNYNSPSNCNCGQGCTCKNCDISPTDPISLEEGILMELLQYNGNQGPKDGLGPIEFTAPSSLHS